MKHYRRDSVNSGWVLVTVGGLFPNVQAIGAASYR
jgi:hypothetical protein